jgi:hypothetical protein
MKAQLQVRRHEPSVSPVIKRVAILAGFSLAFVWLFLEFCSTLLRLFE